MDGGDESILERGHLTCHCLLVETAAGLVLIDTGYGLRDVEDPAGRLSRLFLTLLRPDMRRELTAVRQIRSMGWRPADVEHIVLSHLDFDHAGGLDDFPHATVHLLAAERTAAEAQATFLDRMRYRPQQWSSRARWRTYRADGGERFQGFDGVQQLAGLPPEILLVPLVGHTLGHAGVAVRRDHDWLLYAGDAYFFHREMDAKDPYCPPGLRVYQWMMEKDRAARRANQRRLRDLAASNAGVRVFCAHDAVEFRQLSGRSPQIPSRFLAQRTPAPARAMRPSTVGPR